MIAGGENRLVLPDMMKCMRKPAVLLQRRLADHFEPDHEICPEARENLAGVGFKSYHLNNRNSARIKDAMYGTQSKNKPEHSSSLRNKLTEQAMPEGQHSTAKPRGLVGAGKTSDTARRKVVTQTPILKPLTVKKSSEATTVNPVHLSRQPRSLGSLTAGRNDRRGPGSQHTAKVGLSYRATAPARNKSGIPNKDATSVKKPHNQLNLTVGGKGLARSEASKINELFRDAVQKKGKGDKGGLHSTEMGSRVARSTPVKGLGSSPRMHSHGLQVSDRTTRQGKGSKYSRPVGGVRTSTTYHNATNPELLLPEITMDEVLQSWDVHPRRNRSSSNVGIKNPLEFLIAKDNPLRGETHSGPEVTRSSYEELRKCRYLRLGREDEEERLSHGNACSCNSCEHVEGLKNSPYLNA